jgi:hypothetical protein
LNRWYLASLQLSLLVSEPWTVSFFASRIDQVSGMAKLENNTVFIDANIYLNCYERRYKDYRKLLENVASIKKSVLFTMAVSDEVKRNRAGAYVKQNKVPIFVPEDPKDISEPNQHHLATEEDDSLKEIKNGRKDLKSAHEELVKKVKDFHLKNIKSIVDGRDDVSRAISHLKVTEPTAEQMDRARHRKEVGNPPGKPDDPLGDQISWEQLIDKVTNKSSIWLVSNDGDYLVRAENEVFLNPYLMDELSKRYSDIKIFCFDNLADFFQEFQKQTSVSPPIPQDRIDNAKKEYSLMGVTGTFSIDGTGAHLEGPAKCPTSPDGKHDFGGPSFVGPSAFGGFSHWQMCKYCGMKRDTGDPYDD